ncbi:hypothetical protein RHMOL_Rhmol08G0317100 [Rhododendron molle]|nr:hypothetical protein RHMOL_Rhmol08G0317100 [Rhododendron molle]
MALQLLAPISAKLILVVFLLFCGGISLPLRCSGDGSKEKEKTLAIIKPDGLAGNHTNKIKEIILDSGFSISREMIVQLDEDSVKRFYVEHSSKSFFPSLLKYMASGPVLIMVLEKESAVADWRAMIGPTDARKAKITHPYSIRAMCGLDLQQNCVHGSDSPDSAARETSFFFKESSSGQTFNSCFIHYCNYSQVHLSQSLVFRQFQFCIILVVIYLWFCDVPWSTEVARRTNCCRGESIFGWQYRILETFRLMNDIEKLQQGRNRIPAGIYPCQMSDRRMFKLFFRDSNSTFELKLCLGICKSLMDHMDKTSATTTPSTLLLMLSLMYCPMLGCQFRLESMYLMIWQPKHEPAKEEFGDWPHGLLAIGTFGNQNTNQTSDQRQPNPQQHQSPSSSNEDELADFTPEEVGKLQKELTKLLRRKQAAPATTKVEGDIQNAADLPLDRFLNCPSSLEVSRRISTAGCSVSGDKDDEDIDRTIRVIIDRCKDVCMEKNRKALGKKSVSFLFKKFICSSGFGPSPSLRDTFQESRMEKLLRTMLSKKMYPQNCSRASSVKKILEDRPTPKMIKGKEEEEEKRKKTSDGSKWVKTDSD